MIDREFGTLLASTSAGFGPIAAPREATLSRDLRSE